MSSILSMDEIAVLDRQIEQLFDYKPIPEHEVKVLCDKVGKSKFFFRFFGWRRLYIIFRREKSFQKKAMFSQ